jgi:hypothetical protein
VKPPALPLLHRLAALLLLAVVMSTGVGGWPCQWPGPDFPGGVPCGCPASQKHTGPHMRIMSLTDDRSQATRASQREWVNAPLVLDMRFPSGNATTSHGQSHTPGEMITPEQVGWGMAGMVMFDGHILPSGLQPLVFDRTTHGLTPGWQNITDAFALALKPFLANSSIDAIMIGDEIVCSGTPFALLDEVITYLRHAVGDKVLMYTNECNDVLDAWPYIPLGLDYISVDYYTDPTNAPEPDWCQNVNVSSSYQYPAPAHRCINSEMGALETHWQASLSVLLL